MAFDGGFLHTVTQELQQAVDCHVDKIYQPARDVLVLHIDADLIVIEKPAGITTLRHADERAWDDRRKQRQPTLDEVIQRFQIPKHTGALSLCGDRTGGTAYI